MEFGKQKISLSEIREIDMVDYLSQLGFQPEKIRSNDYWYLSPLREEKTASFKINRVLNRWYDHGLGRGGNIIDFASFFYGRSASDVIRQFRQAFPVNRGEVPAAKSAPRHWPIKANPVKIIAELPLSSATLIRYLQSRRISIEVAKKYCYEVRYELGGKTCYGIGFRSDLGGFEIRSSLLKLSSSPKGISTFQNGSQEVIVFEGFMDFLSFLTLRKNIDDDHYDFVVLNSLSLFEKARTFLEGHKRVLLYLDRDTAGRNCTQYALSLNSKYEDHSHLYRLHQDFNDWVMNFGKSTCQQQAGLEDDLKLQISK